MKRRYIVTGAAGHLGMTLLRRLEEMGEEVWALILPGQHRVARKGIHYVEGDVRDKDSMRPLFASRRREQLYVIHTAGIIDISENGSSLLSEVNIGGTENIIALCREYRVKRLVYVSSVHAIAEQRKGIVMRETENFSADTVVGPYARSKAEATRQVLKAAKNGMDAVIVHPSGIIGPYEAKGNHLVQMIEEYLRGSLPACVRGGYDFVDVRDVAEGCLLAMKNGKCGGCYILSGQHYEIQEVLEMVRRESHGRNLAVLPMWVANTVAPIMTWRAGKKKMRPLFTKYSLYVLQSNSLFCHDKATRELGYAPRDLHETVRDTVQWYQEGRLTAIS